MRCYLIIFAFVVAFSMATASQAAPKGATPAPKTPPPSQDEQLYRNATFGFRYKVPYGWVERTEEMREPAEPKTDAANGPEASSSSSNSDSSNSGSSNSGSSNSGSSNSGSSNSGSSNSGSSNSKAASQYKSESHKSANNKSANLSDVLLAVFERPPQATGDSVNSAVVIASESAAVYRGLKKAEDFLGPLTELITAQGFKPKGDPSVLEIDARELVRADFSKQLTDKLVMYQSTLVLLAKGQLVSFTFVAGSEDEVDDLIEGLRFGSPKSR